MKEKMAERSNDGIKNNWRRQVAAGVLLVTTAVSGAGCDSEVKTPVVETPSVGEALPVGLLNSESINLLPEGQVKNSFQAELLSVKEDCLRLPNCLGETVKIYRVVTSSDVYSIRFADFKTENEALHTKILSMMDGKSQKVTEINQDLLVKETVVDGVDTKVFGYVDNLGNSHYIFVDRGEKKSLYDPNGNIYDVVAQNTKEVQSYASFWNEPIVVQAEALPSPTPIVTETPTLEPTKEPTVTPTEKPLIEGDIFFDPQTKEDFNKLVESPSPIDSPEAFAKWQIEYLNLVNEKLKSAGSDYCVGIDNTGIMYNTGIMGFGKNKWNIISSFIYNWNGKQILTKTFCIKDRGNNLVPLSITYTTNDSPVFNVENSYKTPPEGTEMFIRYEWDTAKIYFKDGFLEKFLPDKNSDKSLDAVRRFMGGIGTQEDRDVVSHNSFVFSSFH